MAFEKKDTKISEALKESKEKGIPSIQHSEKTRPYTFTLQPSNREKLNQLASKRGYASASKFLNDLIENMQI